MADTLAQIEQIASQAHSELGTIKDAAGLEQFRIRYLGSKGQVKNLTKLIADAPREQKRTVGQRVNEVNGRLEEAFNALKRQLAQNVSADREYVDVTEPGLRPRIGNRHILMKVIDELTELFGRMGFSVAAGPEVEEALLQHPQVVEAAVIGVPDEKYGEAIMAWVMLKSGEQMTEEELRDYCKGNIAHYKIPRYVKFVTSFPMTVTGKVQKYQMRQQSTEELGLQKAASVKTA